MGVACSVVALALMGLYIYCTIGWGCGRHVAFGREVD